MIRIKKPNHLAIYSLNGLVVLEIMLNLWFSDFLCLHFQFRKKLCVGVTSISRREMHSIDVPMKEKAKQPQATDIHNQLKILFAFNL